MLKKKKKYKLRKQDDLEEIRLNYYLKTVMWIIENKYANNYHLRFNHKTPFHLYKKILHYNQIFNKNDLLKKTDNKKSYVISCHGGYSGRSIPLYVIPENIIIHFITPLNYLAYIGNIENSKHLQIIQNSIKDNDTILINIKKQLQHDCFLNTTTFLPGQKCFDINLARYKTDSKSKAI